MSVGDPADSSVRSITSPLIAVRDTGTAKGRGVYAACSFHAGDVVEESPVVLVWYNEIPLTVKQICFNWGKLTGGTEKGIAVALGYGSLYNHDAPSNMRYEADVQNKLIRFVAVRDIAVGEELTINYNNVGPNSDHDKWFEDLNIQPLVSG